MTLTVSEEIEKTVIKLWQKGKTNQLARSEIKQGRFNDFSLN